MKEKKLLVSQSIYTHGIYHVYNDEGYDAARVVRAPSVEATDPAFECHSAWDFFTGAEVWVCVRVCVVWAS